MIVLSWNARDLGSIAQLKLACDPIDECQHDIVFIQETNDQRKTLLVFCPKLSKVVIVFVSEHLILLMGSLFFEPL